MMEGQHAGQVQDAKNIVRTDQRTDAEALLIDEQGYAEIEMAVFLPKNGFGRGQVNDSENTDVLARMEWRCRERGGIMPVFQAPAGDEFAAQQHQGVNPRRCGIGKSCDELLRVNIGALQGVAIAVAVRIMHCFHTQAGCCGNFGKHEGRVSGGKRLAQFSKPGVRRSCTETTDFQKMLEPKNRKAWGGVRRNGQRAGSLLLIRRLRADGA